MAGVPGTFKSNPGTPYRVRNDSTLVLEGRMLRGYRWHLSIAHPNRYPSWDEIKAAVWGVSTIPRDVVLGQAIGPGNLGRWVNVHENCFHLWEFRDAAFEVER